MITTAKQEIDTKFLHGKFDEGEERRARWHDKLAHRAANLRWEDPLKITNTGISSAGLMGTAGVIGATILGYAFMNKPSAPVQQQQPPASAAVDPIKIDVEKNIMFRVYDKDGNLIDVQPLPPGLKKTT